MTGPGREELTVAQVDRLIRAMGRTAFRRWYDAHRRGEAKETAEQLINVLDTLGEDALQRIRVESGAANEPTMVPPLNDDTGPGWSQTGAQAASQRVVTNPTVPNNELVVQGSRAGQPPIVPSRVVAGPTPPDIGLPAVPTPMLNADPQPFIRQATIEAEASTLPNRPSHVVAGPTPPDIALPEVTAALLNASAQIPPQLFDQLLLVAEQLGMAVPTESFWTDADVVVGPDGLRTVYPRARPAENPAVPIADVVVAPPTPPDRQPSKCERCGEEVAGDYSARRAHVRERHAFQPEATELATQEALKEVIGECFPQSVVRNDLMCNKPGCGMEVTLYKGNAGVELQQRHIHQHHLRDVAEDLCPLRCPVRGCTRKASCCDSIALSTHISQTHKKNRKWLCKQDKTACEQLLKRLRAATLDAFEQFFPHTPSGILCLGLSNQSQDEPRATRVETSLLRIDSERLDRPLAEIVEPAVADCNVCGEAVAGSYVDRRQHAIGKHLEGGKLPVGTLPEKQDTLKMAMLRCFPDSIVVNDLMCTRCGLELKGLVALSVYELQIDHVQRHHFDSVDEAARIRCPIVGCTTTYPIPHIRALYAHIVRYHGRVRKLTAADKRDFEQLCDAAKKATAKLHPTFFPITPGGQLTLKRNAPVDTSDDEEELRRLAMD